MSTLKWKSEHLHVVNMSTSPLRRVTPAIVLANPRVTSAQQARASGKPVVFLMGNIHPPEPEAAEALLLVARDILLGERRHLLDSQIVIIAPIFNVDGTDTFVTQDGSLGSVTPHILGVRENADGLDLNRDAVKLETVEANGLYRLLNAWDPILRLDGHLMSRVSHGYANAYGTTTVPAAYPGPRDYMNDRLFPAVRDRVRRDFGLEDLTMPVGTRDAIVPRAYIIPAELTEIVARLRAHDITVDTLAAPMRAEGEEFVVERMRKVRRAGYEMTVLDGAFSPLQVREFPAGSYLDNGPADGERRILLPRAAGQGRLRRLGPARRRVACARSRNRAARVSHLQGQAGGPLRSRIEPRGETKRLSELPVIRARGLTRYYGATVGVEDLDLEVERGEIFGFLGPNGSGKTTTIRLLLDLLRPSRGAAWLFGASVRVPAVRARIGYLPGELALDGRMSGNAMLRFLAALIPGLPDPAHRRGELCDRLGLPPGDLRRRVREYSRGMKQKLGLVGAFQHDPELIILDEPTEGLDPLVRETVFTLMAEAKVRGATVFHSSHVLSEVDRTCDRVAILRRGRLAALMRVDDMRRASLRPMVVEFAGEPPLAELRFPGVELVQHDGRRCTLRVTGAPDALLRVLACFPVSYLAFPESNLEEALAAFYRGDVDPRS